ncbi:MAG: F0F1 ATP synthase subunit gamma [Ilumatobacteraceae bacterium]
MRWLQLGRLAQGRGRDEGRCRRRQRVRHRGRGTQGRGVLRFRGYQLDGSFSGFSDNPTYADAKAIGQRVVQMFNDGEVDSVELVYTRFVSAGVQEVVMRPWFPSSELVASAGDADREKVPAGFEFEPDPASILETLLPRYVEARTYAALLNAAAPEHAFRQRAMKSATDNAEELIKSLSRIMNRARQDAITTEIMEIVSGAEALGSDKEPTIRLADADDLLAS